jgi:uncharacterized phage protein gp47/JayE
MSGTITQIPGVADTTTYGVTAQGFIVKPFQAILNDAFARAQLSFGSDIDLRSSSTIRKIIELSSLDAGLLWMALDDVYHSGFTSTAVGGALDLLGADLGLQRANTQASGQATFKLGPNVAPGSVLTLPPGTLVDTAPPGAISFRLATMVILSNDPTQPYPAVTGATVTAVLPGLSGNIAASQLAQINPTFAARYLSFDPTLIVVSNTAPFSGGDGLQDDTTYRRRLQAQPRTLWTQDAIRSIVTGLDGVRDALVSDPYGGLDTPAPPYGAVCFGDSVFQLPRDVCSPYFFSIVVAAERGVLWATEGTSPNQITGLSDQILAALQPIRPISTFPTLVQADTVEVALRAQLSLVAGADSGTVLAAAQLALTAYIGTLRLGDAVLYSQVLRVLSELPGVSDVQNLRLRRGPPRYGEVVFGPPATFGNPADITAIEAPCGANLTLANTEVAVFDGTSNLSDIEITGSS